MSDVTKIPTKPGMGRSLIHFDERSRLFPVATLIDERKPRDRTWRRVGPYDQGQSSTCVAQTGKGMLNTMPPSVTRPYHIRSKYSIDYFYKGAQANDEWEGDAYDGTSGLGLCRYLTQRGIIKEYRWCFGLRDVLLTLSHFGPVGIGVWWYTGMFYPDSRGLITPTGSREGGHEVELIGVDVSEEVVIGMNSWGKSWGDRGRFRMRWTELDRLLNEGGDAFVIVE